MCFSGTLLAYCSILLGVKKQKYPHLGQVLVWDGASCLAGPCVYCHYLNTYIYIYICIMHVKKRIFELRITNLVFNLWDSLVAGVVINSASNLGARVPSAPSLPPPVLGMVLGCVMRRTQSRWLKKVEKG